MALSSSNMPNNDPASRNDKGKFPLKAVIFAALLPALLGLCSGLFAGSNEIFWDTALGLTTWANFTNGGTWNTVSRADPENIANTIEETINWWPAGQYLPVGLLQLTGLSVEHAGLALAFLATISWGIGGAFVAQSFGISRKSIPWITIALACSYYALSNFFYFIGGETGLMMTLPWIILCALKIRRCPFLLALILPILFLLGSFIKHAFAIHSACIIGFLFLENLRESKPSSNRVVDILKYTTHQVIPFLVAGIGYILLRHFLIDFSASPIDFKNTNFDTYLRKYSFPTYLGYASWAPLLAPFNLGSIIDYYSPRFDFLNGERFWEYFRFPIAALTPLPLGFYTWLSFRKIPIQRFAGITALITSALHFYLYVSGAAIELRDRYYQFPAFLLIIALAAQLSRSNAKLNLSKIIFILGILLGAYPSILDSPAISFCIKQHQGASIRKCGPKYTL